MSVKIPGLFEIHDGEQIVGNDVVNSKGEMAFGNLGGISDLGVYCQSQEELGSGDRVMDFRPRFSNIRKPQEQTARSLGERWDWGPQRPQPLRRTNPRRPSHDCAPMTLPVVTALLRRRGAAGAELPRETPGPKSPRAVTGQDAQGPNCRPSPHAACRRGPRSKRHPQADSGPRTPDLTAGRPGPATVGSLVRVY
ncbi:hypothetical protein PAL_GLEAN10001033 [Pteropus alecto]|uniref:Uncharacterized protein n=1 Tax=Pteropus alecto TaxID=9402 RepID=L5KQ60_PTEAL|nr:hypothetical protein PAL_GLEAN10001033 [Pteropus alecto]